MPNSPEETPAQPEPAPAPSSAEHSSAAEEEVQTLWKQPPGGWRSVAFALAAVVAMIGVARWLAGVESSAPRPGVLNDPTVTAALAAGETIRVACLGDSITELSGYPDRLQQMLAAGNPPTDPPRGPFEVRNFGVSGATLLFRSERPYLEQDRYRQGLAYRPHVVVLLLGTNDTRRDGPNTYQYIDDFRANLKTMLREVASVEPRPRILLCLPPPIYGEGNWNLNNENLTAGVLPAIRAVAKETGVTLVDLNQPLAGHPEWFPDNIHPSPDGARQIAATLYTAITGQAPPAAKELAPKESFEEKP